MAVRRSLAWTTFGQASFMIMNFAGAIVVARLLGPFDMGVFAVAMAVVGLVGVIQSMGLDAFLVREHHLTPKIVETAAAVNLVICLVMSAAIVALALAGGALFNQPEVRDVLLVVAIVPIVGHFNFLPQTMLERRGDFRTLALIKTCSTAFGLVITITLAAHGYRFMSLAYSQLANAIVSNLAATIITRREITFRLSFAEWGRVSRFGFQLFAISAFNRTTARLSEIILGRTLGIAALGLYTRASSNTGQLWDSVHGIIGKVVFVDFSNEVRAGRPLRERYLKVLEVMSGLMWPLFGVVALLAGPLVNLVYGARWHGAANPLSLLCISGIIFVSTTMVWEVLILYDETSRQVRLDALKTVIGTTLFVVGCFISLEAAAAARIGEAIVAQFMYRRHLIRLTRAPASAFGAVYVRSGLSMLAAMLPAAALMITWRFQARVPLEQVALAIGGGGLLWLAVLRATHHVLYQELLRLARRLRPNEVTV